MHRSISPPVDVVAVEDGRIEPLLIDLLSVFVRLCVKGVEVDVFSPKKTRNINFTNTIISNSFNYKKLQ